MNAPTLGLSIIARDEESTLPPARSTKVALLDTGSTDRTVEVFEKWAEREQLPLGYRLGDFEWVDDRAGDRAAGPTLLDAVEPHLPPARRRGKHAAAGDRWALRGDPAGGESTSSG